MASRKWWGCGRRRRLGVADALLISPGDDVGQSGIEPKPGRIFGEEAGEFRTDGVEVEHVGDRVPLRAVKFQRARNGG